MSSRLKDAEIAVNKYGWRWVNMHGIKEILIPPADDEKTHWTAMWDENGIPHYLPEYHKENQIGVELTTKGSLLPMDDFAKYTGK